jgi:hypothetical protein
MGKVIITLESPHLPSDILKELAGVIMPNKNTMQAILLDIVGVTPKEINVTIKEKD